MRLFVILLFLSVLFTGCLADQFNLMTPLSLTGSLHPSASDCETYLILNDSLLISAYTDTWLCTEEVKNNELFDLDVLIRMKENKDYIKNIDSCFLQTADSLIIAPTIQGRMYELESGSNGYIFENRIFFSPKNKMKFPVTFNLLDSQKNVHSITYTLEQHSSICNEEGLLDFLVR